MSFSPYFYSIFITDLNDFLAESRRKSHEQSRKIMRSRERKSRGANAETPSQSISSGRSQVTSDQGRESRDEVTTRGRSTQTRQLGLSSTSRSKAKSKPRVRVRESNLAANKDNASKIARSPTPGSTDIEPEESHPSAQATNCEDLILFFRFTYFLTTCTAESQYTYAYETPGEETVLQFEGWLGANLPSQAEDVHKRVTVAKAHNAPSMEAPRRNSSVSSFLNKLFFFHFIYLYNSL
jgi:hypothetical protein